MASSTIPTISMTLVHISSTQKTIGHTISHAFVLSSQWVWKTEQTRNDYSFNNQPLHCCLNIPLLVYKVITLPTCDDVLSAAFLSLAMNSCICNMYSQITTVPPLLDGNMIPCLKRIQHQEMILNGATVIHIPVCN